MNTAAQFEREYATRSGVTVEWLRSQGRVVLPCDCQSEDCEGWQSISQENAKDELALRQPWKHHPGFVCTRCRGWIDPGAEHVRQVTDGDVKPGDPLYDGAIIARMAVYHEHCAPAELAPLIGARA